MMKKILLIVLPVVMLPVLASEVYDSEIGSILQDVSSTNRMVRLNATNRIDTLMTSLSNREEIATCKLLMAKLRAECADITGDESIYDFHAYNDVTNLCWSVLHDFDSDRTTWPFYGASLLLPFPLSMDKKYGDMFSVATNALFAIDAQDGILIETNVWSVLFGPELLQTSNMRVTFRTIAASSLLLSDSMADVSSYTNGLPASALSVVNAIRSEGR